MSKKYFTILVAVAIIAIGIIYLVNKQRLACFDCSEGGWQKMSEKCGQAIITKNDLKDCLTKFNWSLVNQNTSTDEIKDGYIEIGDVKVLNNPTTKSIKVFIYHQWSVDKDGNLYLLGQLG